MTTAKWGSLGPPTGEARPAPINNCQYMSGNIECLGCGAVRALAQETRQPGECPRCGYLGWAPSIDLTESDRRVLRLRPVARRHVRIAH
jgi:hypothetical protein